jgi:ATP-binding cassette subfamily G (WHITE) protein 2 (SNQ2)
VELTLASVFAGLMENEFGRINLSCEGSYVVPRNSPGSSKYPDTVGPNQACTLFGARPGSSVVLGKDYISVGFQMETVDLWRRNLTVLIGWFIFFQITQLIAIEYFQVSVMRLTSGMWGSDLRLQKASGGGGIAVFAKENAETKKLNEALKGTKGKKKDIVDATKKGDG